MARELGVGRRVAAKELAKVAFCYPPSQEPVRYDVRALDLLRALRGQPHRTLEPAAADWLSRHLEGESMPGTPRKAAGRRNPGLLTPDSALAEELLEEHSTADSAPEDLGGDRLLQDGDVLTVSTTLCIDFGDGRNQHIGAKATTRVIEDEPTESTAERAILATNNAVMVAVDDAEARLQSYYEEREALMAAATQARR